LSTSFITDLLNKLKLQFIPDGKGDIQRSIGPEDILSYMYAIFHSPDYRERYGEFLKGDFPRLPLTSNIQLFRELCGLGDRLTKLHIMEEFGKTISNYPEKGNNVVEKVEYLPSPDQTSEGRVYINKKQYFDGICTGSKKLDTTRRERNQSMADWSACWVNHCCSNSAGVR
ncbi:MAG: hypothetical protein M3Z24_17355, partial [Chloroflexota bacterium]|nr:hypothetical protein [Chloroflexota bacterium]